MPNISKKCTCSYVDSDKGFDYLIPNHKERCPFHYILAPAIEKWEIKEAAFYSDEYKKLLEDGWEPFSVYIDWRSRGRLGLDQRVYFKRKRESESK